MSGVTLFDIGLPIYESIAARRGAHKANVWNERLMRESQAWQERMSSTAFQRMKQDMTAAGFNPLYQMRGGASTPGGGLANMQSETTGTIGTSARALENIGRFMQMSNLVAQNKEILSRSLVNIASAKELEARTDVHKGGAVARFGGTAVGSAFDKAVNAVLNNPLDVLQNYTLPGMVYKFYRDKVFPQARIQFKGDR